MIEPLWFGATSCPSRSRQKRATLAGQSDLSVRVAIDASAMGGGLGLLELEAIAEWVEGMEAADAGHLSVGAGDAGASLF